MAKKEVRVLLVEDSQSTRITYKRVLEDAGFSVLEAAKGQEGWELALAELPDVVLLDLILPDIHGLQVLKNIPVFSVFKIFCFIRDYHRN